MKFNFIQQGSKEKSVGDPFFLFYIL